MENDLKYYTFKVHGLLKVCAPSIKEAKNIIYQTLKKRMSYPCYFWTYDIEKEVNEQSLEEVEIEIIDENKT